NVKTLGVGLHETVLDSVVNHFDEMTRARWSAMQEAQLCGGFQRLTTGRSRNVSHPWRQCCKDRFQSFHRGAVTADHQAVAPLDAPQSPARTDIDVIDSCFLEL